MPHRCDRPLQAQRIGLVASVVALGAIGLVVLSGNYLPPGQALLLYAVASVLTLIHAVSYVCNRFGKVAPDMTTKADAKRDSEFNERHV
jgi:drug/metabolite transporter (DMT)-like permease